MGQPGGHGIEVVADSLSTEILAGGKPGEAGGVFEVESVFMAFECFLNRPSLKPL